MRALVPAGEAIVPTWLSRCGTLAVVIALGVVAAPRAQALLFTHSLPREEFAERRARVLDAIGDGLAVLQGAAEYPAYVRFRQNNQFYYLTGVEVPRAILLLDGHAGTATLFLQPRNAQLERSEGPVLVPGEEAQRLTGIAAIRPRSEFAAAFAAAAAGGRTVYTPFRAEVFGAGTPRAAQAQAEATAEDPWDGRPSREQQFMWRLERTPGIVLEDLDPVIDRLRLIKSDREIALVREATRLAGNAIIEVMRSATPGMHENALEAIGDYVFKHGGSQGVAYFALAASGTNAHYPHYHGGTAELAAGDLVLFDYAPDYRYYASDVTRMFPVNGRWSPVQRELYTVYLRLYRTLMDSVRPGAAPRDLILEAAAKMDGIVAGFPFTRDEHKRAAEAFVERLRQSQRNSLGHMVGMAVHDVQPGFETLQPGMIFTIEPALTIPDQRVYIRLEDVLLVTASGYENLSGFVPADPDAIESLMAERGRFEPQPETTTAGR
jgi:Xaa-Pro aminopeptidase